MIRDSMGDMAYWDKWVEHSQARTVKMLSALALPSQNPVYDPQYSLDASSEFLRLILRMYSRGDPIRELARHFFGILDAWELSNRLTKKVYEEHHLKNCRDWTFDLANLNHYNLCFWLVGLALTLGIQDDQWNRLVMLIDAAGQDELLDRVMATRQIDRTIGTRLLHPKPYARLLKAIDASEDQRPKFLREFVDNWYPELARKGKDELWWYIYGDPVKHPLEKGSYFGRWCIEAAVVAKVFDIDDTLCLGHEHYPGDLLRPNGPSTHAKRPVAKPGFLKMWLGGKR
ncbi:PoNe immunity protein domain-containing protein [Duganella violaceipulchra]|uniref:DUF1911 domain-containing protein n=1 Tax=Duganella violaceipulchra TaxID=2849652 RepID=A0AA41L0Z6_9BURK|nr:PoNe immunity protein domain-containing protein [Duganella violaceicalia]MBV6323876.1 DUF1911 domain-containing protein [Duganella violaceicalia]MCP2007568.1 hypothetical protein [Duganella violaceicalia]